MKLWLMAAALATALLAACARGTDTEKFVATAAMAGEFEIEASRIALVKASSEDVKLVAQQIRTDHEAAAAKLKTAIIESGRLAPAETLDETHKGQISELQATSGPTFDRVYIEQQVKAHEEAVELFTNYAKSGEEGPVKEFAKETLPILETHLSHVRGLNTAPTT